VRVRLSDKSYTQDLKAYLEAAECTVRKVGQGLLEVSIPRAPSEDQALREISLYLRTWQAMNPQVGARVEGEDESRSSDSAGTR